jgi:Ca-activated chloride channel family protein
VPQKITYFSAGDSPMSIGLLFDASASMSLLRDAEKLKTYKAAFKQFFQSGNPANEYFLIGFNKQPQLLSDWTSDTNLILDRFSAAQFKGHTAFYDACYVGLDKASHGKYTKRVVILISDGQDNESSYTYSQVRSLLRQLNVIVYSINILSDEIPNQLVLADTGQKALNELSRMSGGIAFYRKEKARPQSDALASIFAFISNELRHQYIIGFIPPVGQTKNRWHRLKIEVRDDPADKAPRKFTVRGREGY